MKRITISLLTFCLFYCLLSMRALAQDWPDLKHFQAANAELAAHALPKNSVVFMGNSITIGWLNKRPSFFENNPYINRGISGQTTPQMLLRFRQDVLDLEPQVVVILAGTNDIAGNTGPTSLEEILGYITSMVELAQANGIQAVVCSVLPAYDYPWRPGLHPNEKIPKLNTMLQQMAAAKNAVYLDYFAAMADDRNGLPKKYAKDEVHPTAAGYAVMEPLVQEAIAQALTK